MTTATTMLALKEWGAAVHALLSGRQTILLRAGGIHEKAFAVPERSGGGGGFVLFPTVAHSHRERVRAEHADLLGRGEADVSEQELTVRAGVQLVAAVEAVRPAGLPTIADLHIWTDASIRADRVEFRPRHPVTVMVVRALTLPEPVVIPRLAAYGGCRSWLELPAVWDGESGTPAVDDDRLADDVARVRAAVG